MKEPEYVQKETCEERHDALKTALGLKAQHTATMLAVMALLLALCAAVISLVK